MQYAELIALAVVLIAIAPVLLRNLRGGAKQRDSGADGSAADPADRDGDDAADTDGGDGGGD
jgi:hypothetical protein